MRFHPVPGMVCRWHPHIHRAVQPKNFLRKVSRKVLHLPVQVDDTVIAWCWRVFSSRAIPGWNHHRIETTLLGLVGKSSYYIWQLHGGFLQGDAGLLGDSVASMIRWTSIFCICLLPRWWCLRGSRLNTSHCHWTMIVWRMGERGIPKARPWTCIRRTTMQRRQIQRFKIATWRPVYCHNEMGETGGCWRTKPRHWKWIWKVMVQVQS